MMLYLIRAKNKDWGRFVNEFSEDCCFVANINNIRAKDNIAHAFKLETDVVIVDEFPDWKSIREYIALACAYNTDIQIKTYDNLETTIIYNCIKKVTDMFNEMVVFGINKCTD